MEKYEPTVKQHHHTSSSSNSNNNRGHATLSAAAASQSQHNNHHHKPHGDYLNEIHQLDYAYAYYEPGMPMRHQNIPGCYYEEAGPSRPPPPNSIRALLNTARRNNMQRTGGKYSHPAMMMQSNSDGGATIAGGLRSQENVYEEIHDAEKRKMMRAGESVVSLNHSMVEEEFRRVQNRHQRVLGELNLTVEEMLMPPLPSAFVPTTPMSDHQSADPMDFLGSGEVTDGLNGVGSSCSNNNMDMDSGFSGSNSSYIGSLRYQKTATSSSKKAAPNLQQQKQHHQLPINHHADSASSSSFYGGSGATDEMGMISLSSRSSQSLYDNNSGKKSKSKNQSPSHQPQQQGADSKASKVPFWKNKAWRSKLPGFSSTSSINKVGMGELIHRVLIKICPFGLALIALPDNLEKSHHHS